MKREEAIHIIEKEIQIDVRFCTHEDACRFEDALRMAISALRQQDVTVKKCHDLFDEDGGEILNDETVTDRHQMTNADHIRSMTDEKLAKLIKEGVEFCHVGLCEDGETCFTCALDWLKQPYKEEL